MSMKENISIRATTQEKEQIEAYAKMHSVSVSALLKNLFFEKLENEYDLELIKEYEENTDGKLYTLEEAKKVLGL